MAEPLAPGLPAHLEPADLAGLEVLVAGLGVPLTGLRGAGRSAALHLPGFGADVVACDDVEVGVADVAGVRVHTGGSPPQLLEDPQVAWTPQRGAG